jgi:hypothetical protein
VFLPTTLLVLTFAAHLRVLSRQKRGKSSGGRLLLLLRLLRLRLLRLLRLLLHFLLRLLLHFVFLLLHFVFLLQLGRHFVLLRILLRFLLFSRCLVLWRLLELGLRLLLGNLCQKDMLRLYKRLRIT